MTNLEIIKAIEAKKLGAQYPDYDGGWDSAIDMVVDLLRQGTVPNSDAIDARRYRWLRTEEGGAHMVINGELLVGNKLDAAIDAHLSV